MSLARGPSVEIAVSDENDILRITPLGAGSEVGRSCHVLQYKGKTVMLDVGLHPAYSGLAGLPFFDEVDLSTVDLCLVSHFHLDHAAALPYLMTKTDFHGAVYMTYPTKSIFKWLLSDYVRVSNAASDTMLYTDADLTASHARINAVDYHQRISHRGIHATAYNAGHVLGAAMFLIEIAGVRILYTGDYSREEDRHLCAAESISGPPIDVLICESTYGVQSHEPQLDRERRFTSLVHDIVRRNGRCLIPTFALGRAQELLLILDEYWAKHPSLHSIPVYFASSLAKKCMAVYQTYINQMNKRIQLQAAVKNPFVFRWISNLRNMDRFEDAGACVMMASPGMLQSGLSRELFERWCVDKRNGVVITGYSVDGTLAKHILNEPTEIQTLAGGRLALRASVDYISFSAHVDFTQNSAFIEEVKAPHVVLVHGDSNAMARLRSAMESRFKDAGRACKFYTPRNCETVPLYFRGEKQAKAIGRLAARVPEDGQRITGVLAVRDFQFQLMAPEDVAEITGLPSTRIQQRLHIPYAGTWGLLLHYIKQLYDGLIEYVDSMVVDEEGDTMVPNGQDRIKEEEMSVKDEPEDESVNDIESTKFLNIVKVYDTVTVRHRRGDRTIMLEWDADPFADMITDSLIAVVCGIESCPASVKLTQSKHDHAHADDDGVQEMDVKPFTAEDEKMMLFLGAHFGNGQVGRVNEDDDVTEGSIRVQLDDHECFVNVESMFVKGDNAKATKRVQDVVNSMSVNVRPLAPLPRDTASTSKLL